MIPYAMGEVKSFVENDNLSVQSKYFSAIASFGVSVLQSGVHATELFYSDKGDERKNIAKMIASIIRKEKNIDKILKEHAKDDILDAITAMKLAIRTYKKIENKNKEAQHE